MRIRNLEDRLGVSIVRRAIRFQGLIEEGDMIVQRARSILDDTKALEQQVLGCFFSGLGNILNRAFCKTQANSSSDIASLHDDWILVSTLHDSLDLAAKFRPDSTKNPFKPSKRV